MHNNGRLLIRKSGTEPKIRIMAESHNKSLILKYFDEFKNLKDDKYLIFEQYLIKFNDFCFELSPEIVIKEAIKFKVN